MFYLGRITGEPGDVPISIKQKAGISKEPAYIFMKNLKDF